MTDNVPESDGVAGRDSFDGLILDEQFVAGALFHEDVGADRIARAARIVAAHEQNSAWRAAFAVPAHRHPATPAGRRRRRLPILILLVVAGVVALWISAGTRGGTQAASGSTGAGPVRLLPPPTVPVTGISYAFTSGKPRQDGLPRATWNPCEPIHYVLREEQSIAGGDRVISSAMDQVSKATGLLFVFDGTTVEAPSPRRDAVWRGNGATRWAPVLVAWSNPTESPALAEEVAGFAGPVERTEDGRPTRYVSGQVILDAPALADLAKVDPLRVQAVVLHELGHLVGLAHVDDPTQLMNAKGGPGRPSTFADGDRRGLALLGSGSCN